MGGAGGHMWHPFDCPDVNSGQDLISFFQKSIESANNETELIFTAADNSIKKYEKFNNATINKVRLKEIIFKDLLFLLKAYF